MQTLWSWTLHTLCFLPFYPSKLWTLLTYGPSAGGAWALMVMWMWTMKCVKSVAGFVVAMVEEAARYKMMTRGSRIGTETRRPHNTVN